MDGYTRPDPSRAALFTIDVQNDFTLPGAPAEIEGTAAVLPEIRTLLDAFRSASAPVVHVVRLYRADGSNVDRCRRGAVESGAAVVRPGTAGAELVDELQPSDATQFGEAPPDTDRPLDDELLLDADNLLAGELQPIGPEERICYKPRWGAFYETKLGVFLDDLNVNTLVVCGCNFPNCPRTTIYEASERDYRLVFVPDATSGTYERGVEELADIGVAVKSATETGVWLAQ